MKTRVLVYTFIQSATSCVLLLLLLCCGHSHVRAFEWPLDTAETQIVKKVVAECLERDVHACLAEKLARAVDHSLDWDLPLFDGVTLRRNEVPAENLTTSASAETARTATGSSGVEQLYASVTRFIDAHTLSVDFGEARTIGDIEFRAGTGTRKRIGKRERRRVQYALFVLLGIFGLTAPLILKTLGIIAGKALIASKVALIMLGSIALKKIFQADTHSPVKVHTHTIPIHDDDHDRYDYGGGGGYTYYTANKFTKPPLNLL